MAFLPEGIRVTLKYKKIIYIRGTTVILTFCFPFLFSLKFYKYGSKKHFGMQQKYPVINCNFFSYRLSLKKFKLIILLLEKSTTKTAPSYSKHKHEKSKHFILLILRHSIAITSHHSVKCSAIVLLKQKAHQPLYFVYERGCLLINAPLFTLKFDSFS